MDFNIPESTDLRRASDGAQYELKEIKPYHKEIANLLAVGLKPPEIAERLNLDPQTIRNVANFPVIVEMVSIIQHERADQAADIAADLAEIAPAAIQLLDEVINYNNKLKNGGVEKIVGEPDLDMQRKTATDVLKLVVPKERPEPKRYLVGAKMLDIIKQRCLQTEAEEAEFIDLDEEKTNG